MLRKGLRIAQACSVENGLARGNGILRLEPAWVARDFLLPARRLGLEGRRQAEVRVRLLALCMLGAAECVPCSLRKHDRASA